MLSVRHVILLPVLLSLRCGELDQLLLLGVVGREVRHQLEKVPLGDTLRKESLQLCDVY